jgi:hypothetical protein
MTCRTRSVSSAGMDGESAPGLWHSHSWLDALSVYKRVRIRGRGRKAD